MTTEKEINDALTTGPVLINQHHYGMVLEFIVVKDSIGTIWCWSLLEDGRPPAEYAKGLSVVSHLLSEVTILDTWLPESAKCTCDFLSVILITGCRCGGQ